MARLRVIHKLETLWTRIGISAQIDPLVMQELESIPEGTFISFSCLVKGSDYTLELLKEGSGFIKATADSHFIAIIRIHCTSYSRLHELIHAKRKLSEMIASGDIRVQGASPMAMSIIRLIQQSLPYTGGMRKARRIATDVFPPLEYSKRRFRYLMHRIRIRGVKV